MKGFGLTALGLTFMYALLQGQSSGKGGNVTGLLGVPRLVIDKILNPNEPFFRAPGSKPAPPGAPHASYTPTPAPAPHTAWT